jgi:hypothetical protein
MSIRALFRLAASALILSGVLLAVGLILHPVAPYAETVPTTHWAVSHLFFWIGASSGIVGLTGAYLWQREQTRWLGFIGYGLAVLGLALISSSMFFEAFLAPPLAARAPELFEGFPSAGGWEGFLAAVVASGGLFGIGFILFGIATFRADMLPRWAVGLAVLGGVPFAVNFLLPRPFAILAVTALAVGLSGMGMRLWSAFEPERQRLKQHQVGTAPVF